MWFLLLKHVLVGPVLRVLGRPRATGRQHVPTRGPVVLAGNHLAFVDSLYLPLLLRRRPTFVAKSEYFTGRGVRGALVRWFFASTGQVPVDRRGGDAARAALDAATAILGRGEVWAIYPEGTRSPDGRLHRGHTGAMRVALATGAPVVPFALTGTDRMSRGRLLRPGRVHLAVGAPLDLAPYAGDVRAATDHLMAVVAGLSGQERVDHYARRGELASRAASRVPPVGGTP